MSRSPYGERGLKYDRVHPDPGNPGRSPYGERGLKSCSILFTVFMLMSLPVRGAWIEIAVEGP